MKAYSTHRDESDGHIFHRFNPDYDEPEAAEAAPGPIVSTHWPMIELYASIRRNGGFPLESYMSARRNNDGLPWKSFDPARLPE